MSRWSTAWSPPSSPTTPAASGGRGCSPARSTCTPTTWASPTETARTGREPNMTTTQLPARSQVPPWAATAEHGEAMRAAATEYERGEELLAGLDAGQWAAPTVNTGWDVRAT